MERLHGTATESGCFIVVIGHEVGSFMVSVVPVAMLVPKVMYLYFCHGCCNI